MCHVRNVPIQWPLPRGVQSQSALRKAYLTPPERGVGRKRSFPETLTQERATGVGHTETTDRRRHRSWKRIISTRLSSLSVRGAAEQQQERGGSGTSKAGAGDAAPPEQCSDNSYQCKRCWRPGPGRGLRGWRGAARESDSEGRTDRDRPGGKRQDRGGLPSLSSWVAGGPQLQDKL